MKLNSLKKIIQESLKDLISINEKQLLKENIVCECCGTMAAGWAVAGCKGEGLCGYIQYTDAQGIACGGKKSTVKCIPCTDPGHIGIQMDPTNPVTLTPTAPRPGKTIPPKRGPGL